MNPQVKHYNSSPTRRSKWKNKSYILLRFLSRPYSSLSKILDTTSLKLKPSRGRDLNSIGVIH